VVEGRRLDLGRILAGKVGEGRRLGLGRVLAGLWLELRFLLDFIASAGLQYNQGGSVVRSFLPNLYCARDSRGQTLILDEPPVERPGTGPARCLPSAHQSTRAPWHPPANRGDAPAPAFGR